MPTIAGQFQFADANGNATVISVYNGDWVFTSIQKANYMVSTNYNLANISNGEYPCWRYNNAILLLQQIDTKNITEESLVAVLKSTHLEGQTHTVYSYLVNVKTLDIALFYEHDFTTKKVFNLQTELNQGEHTFDLGQLFYQSRKTNNIEGFGVMTMNICLVSIFGLNKIRRKN